MLSHEKMAPGRRLKLAPGRPFGTTSRIRPVSWPFLVFDQAAKKHLHLKCVPGFAGRLFSDCPGHFGPPWGPDRAQNVAQKHRSLGTKYRPNRPNGDPIGGHFSFFSRRKSLETYYVAKNVMCLFVSLMYCWS